MFLSIIIPVYNGSLTILRCLESIWSQNLPEEEYEVICIDDCSRDNTMELLLEYNKEHRQLRILHNNENLRAGGARNYGVREAKGDYIVFIDADDLFYKDALCFVCNYLMGGELDVLMLDFSRQHSLQDNAVPVLKYPCEKVLGGIDFIKINSCPFGPCKFIFKRSLMVENSIWFEEKCCCEDVDWCVRLVLSARLIQYLPRILSHVIINDYSQTAIEHKSLKTVSDKLFAGSRLMHIIDQSNVSNDQQLTKYIRSVADLYYCQGIKYMTACQAKLSDKVSVISYYFANYMPSSMLLRFARSHPYTFSLISNITSYALPSLISFKRKFFKR